MNIKGKKALRILSAIATLTGVVLNSGTLLLTVLPGPISDRLIEYLASALMITIGSFGEFLVLRLIAILIIAPIPGIPLILAGFAGTILTHSKTAEQMKGAQSHCLGNAAIGVGVIAHLLALAFSIQLFLVPEGTDIRPMLWTMMIIIIALTTLVIAVPLGIASIIKERPRLFGIIGTIMGLTPFVFSIVLLIAACKIKGLTLSP